MRGKYLHLYRAPNITTAVLLVRNQSFPMSVLIACGSAPLFTEFNSLDPGSKPRSLPGERSYYCQVIHWSNLNINTMITLSFPVLF